jgi:hypothetical protein
MRTATKQRRPSELMAWAATTGVVLALAAVTLLA